MRLFRNIAVFAVIVAMATSVTGCGRWIIGEKVEVPPAHVGRILTKNGYAPEVIPPSRFRLPNCFTYCDKLILLEAADVPFIETMQIFMPDDKLNLSVDVRGTLTVSTDRVFVDQILDRVTSEPTDDYWTQIITAKRVYATYGVNTLRGVVRSELTKHSIADILDNRDAIGRSVHSAIVEKLVETKTPIRVSRFELADVQPPGVIVEAQQAAKQRQIDVQRAEADAQVDMVQAEKALEVAKLNRLVEREKAEAIAEQNIIAAESITPQLLAYRQLEVMERIYTELANGKNEGLVVIPLDTAAIASTNAATVLGKVVGKELK